MNIKSKIKKCIIKHLLEKTFSKWTRGFKVSVIFFSMAILDIILSYILVEFLSGKYLESISFAYLFSFALGVYLIKHKIQKIKLNKYSLSKTALIAWLGFMFNLVCMYFLVEKIGYWYVLAKAITDIVLLFMLISLAKILRVNQK